MSESSLTVQNSWTKHEGFPQWEGLVPHTQSCLFRLRDPMLITQLAILLTVCWAHKGSHKLNCGRKVSWSDQGACAQRDTQESDGTSHMHIVAVTHTHAYTARLI